MCRLFLTLLMLAIPHFEFVLVPGAGHGAAESRWASAKRSRFLSEKLRAIPNSD